ncbi:hypothetical protein BN7_1397 [Wickerhamomyces ciferrii]|uniref:[PSI+] induction protein 2 n=1 Tax=Wickerhamomyces ciferrii (strain ATCC 14091 / BCRC 22168 / CBS 111 / JCM 3599 / NBRC 0793 / NRRL Y-1031 F-60-10) TaxID=1206466 RepID=K0KL82_WICCF|nr:uncharacterized protein BN7_1397 [Wickerhamomyces ciferrii]CCH41858.1 hypothetical protein BN7_1397 [Wickerhamomyces ciferrii]
MLLPSSTSDLCPSKLLSKRAFTSDVVSTAESFKHWDTCMDNKTCKIVAIVGIVVAAIVLFGIFGVLLRCFCCGVEGIWSACCCCFRCCGSSSGSGRRQRDIEQVPLKQQQTAYDNPNMYPPKPAPIYDNNSWNTGGYRPVQQPQNFNYGPGVVSDEEKYNYHNNGYHTAGQTYR